MSRTPVARAPFLTCAALVAASIFVPITEMSAQQQLCDLDGEAGAIFGSVSDAMSKVALPGVEVMASWTAEPAAPESPGVTTPRTQVVKTTNAGSTGTFALCDIPAGPSIYVSVKLADYSIEERVVVQSGEITEIYFEMDMNDQDGGRVLGRVIDGRTNRPISSANIELLSADGEEGAWQQTVSDAQGRFLISDVYPGTYSVTVQHVGYDNMAELITVPERRTVEVNARMSADPIELEPLVVTAVRNRFLENKGFYDRKDWGERLSHGHFILRPDIERRNPMRVGHLLLDLPSIRCNSGMNSRGGCLISSSRTPKCEYLAVWVDGVELIQPPQTVLGTMTAPPQTIDEIVMPVEVEAIEVYPTPTSVPAEFAGMNSRCGAVAIWTRRG